MTRSQLTNLPEFFDRYINLCDDVTIIEALTSSIEELDNINVQQLLALGDFVYAPGKWTIKDIFQHMVDTERVFAYRALILSRGEKLIASFDENMYADNATATRRSLEEIIEEFMMVKKSTLALISSMDEEMLSRYADNRIGELSPRALAYTSCGHQRWHMKIIAERYLL